MKPSCIDPPFFFFTWLEHSPCEPSCNTESLRLIDIAEGGPDRNECLVDRSKRGPLQSLWEKGQPISTIVFTLQETKSHHPSLGMPVGQAACSLSLSLCQSRLRIPFFQRLPGESDEGFILLSTACTTRRRQPESMLRLESIRWDT